MTGRIEENSNIERFGAHYSAEDEFGNVGRCNMTDGKLFDDGKKAQETIVCEK